MVQNDKTFCLSHSISQETYIWLSFVVCKCKMIISSSIFFIFLKLWFFRLRGSKAKKMAQNDKKLCLLCLISPEPYIIWSSFMVHMCNRIISSGVFLYLFQIFIFIDSDFWYTCVKWWHLQMLFSFFFLIWFFWLLGGWE